MSSGLRGYRVASTAPSCIALATAAARDEIAAKLREDDALAHGVDPVTAAADALEPAGDRRRRLDLDDEIDRAHVDAELERRGRDKRAQVARL